jgi:hypothetical protein
MQKKLQAEVEAWKGLPEVKAQTDAFEADSKDFVADRAKGIQDEFRDLTNGEVAAANKRIRLKAMQLTGEQRREQMGSIVEAEYAKATKTLKDFKADVRTRAVAFEGQLLAANNHGVPFEADIMRAFEAGLINRGEVESAVTKNNAASDISNYTADSRVENAVENLFPTREMFNDYMMTKEVPWRNLEDARLRAFDAAREWAVMERGQYESKGAADAAFTEFINKKMRPDVAEALGIEGADKPAGASAKPGGPTQTEEDMATKGKAFQSVLDTGDAGMLKIAGVKEYPLPRVKSVPQPLTRFQENFGQRNGQMQKIRSDARKEIAVATDANVKRALLNTGIATPNELLKGSMVVDGVTIPIASADIDIWKAMVFVSTTQFEQACSTDDGTEMLYMIAEKYGISSNDDFDIWINQQRLLLKVNGL